MVKYLVGQHLFFAVEEWWWLNRLNAILQHAYQHGLMQYYEARTKRIMKIVADVQPVRGLSEKSLTSITITELRFIFIIFLVGSALSMLAFGSELFHYRWIGKGKSGK